MHKPTDQPRRAYRTHPSCTIYYDKLHGEMIKDTIPVDFSIPERRTALVPFLIPGLGQHWAMSDCELGITEPILDT